MGQLGAALNTMLTKIEQAFRDKEASEEQLRRFVADASHELRTPLTSIRGYAELFRNGLADRPDDLASAMRRIESESSRMAGLVRTCCCSPVSTRDGRSRGAGRPDRGGGRCRRRRRRRRPVAVHHPRRHRTVCDRGRRGAAAAGARQSALERPRLFAGRLADRGARAEGAGREPGGRVGRGSHRTGTCPYRRSPSCGVPRRRRPRRRHPAGRPRSHLRPLLAG